MPKTPSAPNVLFNNSNEKMRHPSDVLPLTHRRYLENSDGLAGSGDFIVGGVGRAGGLNNVV